MDTTDIPANLPIGAESPSYIDAGVVEEASFTESDIEVNSLEERAHQNHVLLSSDAIRHFIKVAGEAGERVADFDLVIEESKKTFPSEDGWTVLNLVRMQEVCEKVLRTVVSPVGAGVSESENIPMSHSESLAVAVVSGRMTEAYRLIEDRPMVALAEAVSKIDAVYRERKGEVVGVVVSDGLRQALENTTKEKLQLILESLTTVLDGVHTDERTAVKMAIMKAINASNS